jgi:hypothetical protein
MKWPINEVKYHLMKWPFVEMTCWQNARSMKWPINEITVDQMFWETLSF